jgi:hypothetical protein
MPPLTSGNRCARGHDDSRLAAGLLPTLPALTGGVESIEKAICGPHVLGDNSARPYRDRFGRLAVRAKIGIARAIFERLNNAQFTWFLGACAQK